MTANGQEVALLGIESMDREHSELARLFEEFTRCVESGASEAQTIEIVQQAMSSANTHFDHEEQLAEAAHYPKIDEEKRHHRNMRLKCTALVGDTLNFRSRNPVTLEHLYEIRAMLVEHINGPDRELAEFLKAAGYH